MIPEAEIPIWSKSRAALWKECRRKFFFTTQSSAAAEETARLKKLTNRYLWSGSSVHEAIGRLLQGVRQGEPCPAVDEIVHETRRAMREEFKASQGDGGPFRLFEHEYGTRLAPFAWQQQWGSVEKSLRWFLGSDWFRRLKLIPPEGWKAVDETLSFEVEGVKAFVKIDCAIEMNGRFALMDWKTSGLRPEDGDSLLVAALYAVEVWGAEPESIDAFAVSLKEGRHARAPVDAEALTNAALRIQHEALRMDEDLKSAGADPFRAEMPAERGVCRRCNFQRLCHPGGLHHAV